MAAHKSLNQNLNNQLWNNFSPSNRMELAQGVVGFLKNHDRLGNDTVEMLNLGSGVGITSSCLEKVYPFFHITDIDQIPYRKELMNERYLQNDISCLPFRDASYDALFSSYTFSYLGNSERVMREWLRVLRPGGGAYFVFHAPNSAYLQTAREMTSANMGRDFLRLIKQYPGPDYNGLYRWFCEKNFAWGMAFKEEQKFLSYAHEIQVCDHLVKVVAKQMFNSAREITDFFETLGVEDISVNMLGLDFVVRSCQDLAEAKMVAWFVVFRKRQE